MTLNSEGLLPCPFCGGENSYVQNAGWKANTFIRCPDCPSSFATCDGPRPHEDSVVAWNRRALPPVDGLEVVAWLCKDLILRGSQTVITDIDHAWMRKAQPKAWAVDDLIRLSQAFSVIAGLKEEVTRLTKERDEVAERAGKTIAAANDAVHVAEEENKRLREALDEIEELNLSAEDENGHRWANSDMIAQTITLVRPAKEGK